MVFQYIQTLKSILNTQRQEDLARALLQMIKAVGFEQIGHISFLVLIYLEDNVNLKDDLTLDGPLLQLAYQVLLTSIVDTKSLETLQNAIAVLCSSPLCQKT